MVYVVLKRESDQNASMVSEKLDRFWKILAKILTMKQHCHNSPVPDRAQVPLTSRSSGEIEAVRVTLASIVGNHIESGRSAPPQGACTYND